MEKADLNFSMLKPGPKVFEITGFQGNQLCIERLKELGLFQGLKLVYQSQMPFNGPRLLRFGATVLALRQEEAECLRVK